MKNAGPQLCLTQASAAAPSPAKPGCEDRCGNYSIPYPFGIGKDCYYNEWFAISCNSSSSFPTPLLSHPRINLEVQQISVEYQTVSVQTPMPAYCQNQEETNRTWDSIDLKETPFFFSAERNSLRVIGCGNAVLVTRSGITLAGCSSFCQNTTNNFVGNGGCFGINCCQATIPSNLNFFRLNTTATSYLSSESPCTFAALGNGFSTDQASPQQSWASIELTWMIEEAVEGSQCQKNTLNGAEVGNYTYYNCSCLPYEEGNPYLPHACQVPEVCKNCAECRKEADGSFSCVVRGSTSTSSTSPKPLILGLSFGIGGSVFLIIGSCWLYKFIKKQRVIKRKEHFFKRNGGLLLQQEMSSDRIAVEKTKIFSSEELAIATENFNKNRILGQGGQGTVYKGMLIDGKIVAIKKSKIVDEDQLEQFINEIMILSQINHRNIMKLLGCCLETEVPLLVFEFISNGTLFQLIHDKNNEFPFSWEMRLQIAAEVADAITYLHSASSVPIYHRDIKSSNILLDDKYKAKVSDFGISRSVSLGQTHLTTLVQGTFGYLDPEYFVTNHFTEKSDVYSFGVVLVELLTGQKPIPSTRSEEERSLVAYFTSSLEQGRLFDIIDNRVMKEGGKDEILAVANLASRCLHFKGKERPTMKEVTKELEHFRTSFLPFSHVPQNIHKGESMVTEMTGPLDSTSTSTEWFQHDKKSSSYDV